MPGRSPARREVPLAAAGENARPAPSARSSEEERRPSKPMVGGSNPPGRISRQACRNFQRPRVESNHRSQLRRLPLCPLSYGAGARVADGTRTRDHRDHNPGLYQLSYRHRARTSYPREPTGLNRVEPIHSISSGQARPPAEPADALQPARPLANATNHRRQRPTSGAVRRTTPTCPPAGAARCRRGGPRGRTGGAPP